MAEDLEAAERFVFAAKTLSDVREELRSELTRVMTWLVDSGGCQADRRVFVRSYWSYIEALAYCTKRFTLEFAVALGIELSPVQRLFLEDGTPRDAKERGLKFPSKAQGAAGNAIYVLREAVSVFGVAATEQLKSDEVNALRRSATVRHRIAHPKSLDDLMVIDEDFVIAHKAFDAFDRAWVGFNRAIRLRHAELRAARLDSSPETSLAASDDTLNTSGHG